MSNRNQVSISGIETKVQYRYSHLFNKRGGGEKIAKSLNVEVGRNVEGGILWKKIRHKSNKRGV